MVLERYKRSLELVLDPVARLFSGVHPDAISTSSFFFAIASGVFFGLSGKWEPEGLYGRLPWLLLFAWACIGLNSLADTMDGRIARMTGKTSKVGDFLDHTFDRLSDIAILMGIAFSPYCNTIFGLIGVTAVLLASYMGTQAQAVGCGRNYSGVMGRAERMVLLLLVIPLQFLVMAGWDSRGIFIDIMGGLKLIPLEMLMGLMLVGGGITVLMRGYDTIIGLRRMKAMEAEEGIKGFDGSRRKGFHRKERAPGISGPSSGKDHQWR